MTLQAASGVERCQILYKYQMPNIKRRWIENSLQNTQRKIVLAKRVVAEDDFAYRSSARSLMLIVMPPFFVFLAAAPPPAGATLTSLEVDIAANSCNSRSQQ